MSMFMIKAIKREHISFIGAFFFSLFAIGCINPLIGQYLDCLQYSGFQIGIITSFATAFGAISAPLWSALYEKRNNEKIMLLIYWLAAISMFLLIFVQKFHFFLFLYTLAFSLEAPIRPLNDARLLKSKYVFGDIRLWGSVGFAVGSFFASQAVSLTGFKSIFFLYTLSLTISGLSLRNVIQHNQLLLLKRDDVIHSIKNKSSIISIAKNKQYLILLMSAFFINGTCIANNTYFGFLYHDSGGSISGLGITFLLMVASEAPWMYFIEKLLKRFSIEQLILCAMIISCCRFYFYSMGVSHIWLSGTFFLPGIVNGFLWVLFAKYIAKLIDSEILDSAVAIYTAIASSISTIACQFLAGIILDKYGSSQVYFMFAILNIFSILIFIFAKQYRTQKSLNITYDAEQ